MMRERRSNSAPFFSICIPQFNRTSFLLVALKAIQSQCCENFEICISDGGSTDGRESEILNFLDNSSAAYVYRKQPDRCLYDKNLRCALELARGRYVLLCGNDDALADANTLKDLFNLLSERTDVGVLISNYADWRNGAKTRRILKDGFEGKGPWVAATHYRNLAFVSGLILDRSMCQAVATDRWDGSEMYQMYVASRIIASGKTLVEIDKTIIKKDIQVVQEIAESYIHKPKEKIHWNGRVTLPMLQLGPLVLDAIRPYVSDRDVSKYTFKIWQQLYCFTYPFWIMEYRKVQSWKYAFCLSLALSPHYLVRDIDNMIGWILWIIYFLSMTIALLLPLGVYTSLKPFFYKLAKKA